MMDETLGCARVRAQFGDDVKQIEVVIGFQISCIMCIGMNTLNNVYVSSDT